MLAEGADSPRFVTVADGDTLEEIARLTGCSERAIRKKNTLEDKHFRPGKRLQMPRDCRGVLFDSNPHYYTTQAGDTLAEVAVAHGCRARTLRGANDIEGVAPLEVGTALRLPGACRGGSTPASEVRRRRRDAYSMHFERALSVHRVTAKETLESLAAKRGCDPLHITRANLLPPRTKLSPGQEIILPYCLFRKDLTRSDARYDSSVLAHMMAARGFRPPRDFRALVIELTFDEKNLAVIEERRFDYGGQSSDARRWNPGSTVKIFSAVGALQRIRALGFSPDDSVTFFGRRRRPRWTTRELVEAALIESDNFAHNRLMQLAGSDHMNGTLLTEKNGLPETEIPQAFAQKDWKRRGERVWLHYSPRIVLGDGEHEHEIPWTKGTVRKKTCFGSACTSLRELGEIMRRLMLQEVLPEGEGLGLSAPDLVLLRDALGAERIRGGQVAKTFRGRAKRSSMRIFNKPGYTRRWYSDNLFISDPERRRGWVVVMTAPGGRYALNQASEVLTHLLYSGDLRAVP